MKKGVQLPPMHPPLNPPLRYLIYTVDVFDVLKHSLNGIANHKSNLQGGPKPGQISLKKTLSRHSLWHSLWAYIAIDTSKGCLGDAHTP